VIGPEVPLVAGIVDAFVKEKLLVLRTNKTAAELERSKVFAKDVMRQSPFHRRLADVHERRGG